MDRTGDYVDGKRERRFRGNTYPRWGEIGTQDGPVSLMSSVEYKGREVKDRWIKFRPWRTIRNYPDAPWLLVASFRSSHPFPPYSSLFRQSSMFLSFVDVSKS